MRCRHDANLRRGDRRLHISVLAHADGERRHMYVWSVDQPWRDVVERYELEPETLMRTYLEQVVAKGELDLIERMAHADMVDEANQAFGGPAGRAGLVAHVKGFLRCIDDVELTIERIVGGDDSVMAWWSFSGVHVGPWLGQPPTGKPIQATVFSFFDLVDGRVSRYGLWLHAGFDEPVIFDSSRPELLPLPRSASPDSSG